MSVEEACDLGKRAIMHAAHRDAMSGGVVNLVGNLLRAFKIISTLRIIEKLLH